MLRPELAVPVVFLMASRHPDIVTVDLDFRLHVDRSQCVGTQYFELCPGRYTGAHWIPGARFIDEYTFCLFEGIFERRLPDYDHFGCVDVGRDEWTRILSDLAELRLCLIQADGNAVEMPFGSTLRIEDAFQNGLADNQRGLISLLSEIDDWAGEVLREHDSIALLGL